MPILFPLTPALFSNRALQLTGLELGVYSMNTEAEHLSISEAGLDPHCWSLFSLPSRSTVWQLSRFLSSLSQSGHVTNPMLIAQSLRLAVSTEEKDKLAEPGTLQGSQALENMFRCVLPFRDPPFSESHSLLAN